MMKRRLIAVGLVLVLLAAAGLMGAWWLVRNQGATQGEWSDYSVAKVKFDRWGIPTIEGVDWPKVIEAQGYVVASDRFFHMDLMRRAGGGRLAEVFGPDVVAIDKKRRLEDWLGTADRAYTSLPEEEKAWLVAYAKGVNEFLGRHAGRVSIEYQILRLEPEPWAPRDTLLILLLMCEQLATSAPGEANMEPWRKALPAPWFDLLFATDHPWNQPMFGDKPRDRPALPTEALPMGPIKTARALPPSSDPFATAMASVGLSAGGSDDLGGSNSWAWCRGESCFLANDPHLGATVPHLWYAVRLRTSPSDFVVGVSIPGIPGVTLGMNGHLAWAFTNVGEDVDDYLLEELSEDGTKYVLKIENGQKVWADVVVEPETIQVKGAAPITVNRRKTARGPIDARDHLEGIYARKWLPFQEGRLHVPVKLSQAKSWEELNLALDGMTVPAQNVLMIDRRGNLGYRASGTGIDRVVSGRRPQTALEGDWKGYLPTETRPRVYYYLRGEATGPGRSHSSTVARYLATANERIWVDRFGHGWTHDLRKERIRRYLEEGQDFTQADMTKLQLDTQSRAYKLLLSWIVEHAVVEGAEAERLLAKWRAWDGSASSDVEIFTEAQESAEALSKLCLDRVRQHLLPPADRDVVYDSRQPSAWMITALEDPRGLQTFGLDPEEVADYLVAQSLEKARTRVPHNLQNRWRAQHPLAKAPVIGAYFAVDEPPQIGAYVVPRVESPKYGASTRLVWNLFDPKASTWSLPVGQSGHIGSRHYSDLQGPWTSGKPLPVFDDGLEWIHPEDP